MVGAIVQLLTGMVSMLPASPFAEMLDSIEEIPYLGYLNWLIPFDRFVPLMGGWLVCMGTYYLYQNVRTKLEGVL